MSKKVLNQVLSLLGVLVFIPGLLEVLFSITGRTYQWTFVAFNGNFMLWRGVILLSAGMVYVLAITKTDSIQKRSHAVLASLLIWIVAGMEVLAMVLGSIPGEAGRWITTAEGFVSSYQQPLIPSLLLLPLTVGLVILISIAGQNHEEGG